MCLFKKKCFIIFGPQGSGKGSQSGVICNHFNIITVPMGEMLRENIKNKTEIGLYAQTFMDKGLLVPDAAVVKMIKERLSRQDAKNGALLDGFPRSKTQLEALLKFAKIKLVVNLDVKREILIERLSKRKVCSKCTTNKQKGNDGERCNCGGEWIIRTDDGDINVVNKRLDTYYSETQPLLKKFREKGITVVDVVITDKEKSIEDVNEIVKAKLEATKI